MKGGGGELGGGAGGGEQGLVSGGTGLVALIGFFSSHNPICIILDLNFPSYEF